MAERRYQGFEFRCPTLPKSVYSKMREVRDFEGLTWRGLVIAGHLAFMNITPVSLRDKILAEAKAMDEGTLS